MAAQWGSGESDPFFHSSRLDCGHFWHFRLSLRQCRGADPTGARLWPRSEGDLSRPGAGATARLSCRLCLDLRRVSCRRGDRSRQARHARMAAREGARASAERFPSAVLGLAAASLPVHRQRPRRGHPGEASRAGGDRRPSDPAADPRRQPWRGRRTRAPDRRILRGRTRRPAAHRPARRGYIRMRPR